MKVILFTTFNDWSERVVSLGWSHFLQLVILVIILLLIDATLGKRVGPRWRSALWLIFLVKLFLPPGLSLPTSPVYWWPAETAADQPPAVSQNISLTGQTNGEHWNTGDDALAGTAAAGADSGESGITPVVSWQSVLVGCWITGATVLGILTILRHRRLVNSLELSRPADSRLRAIHAGACRDAGLGSPVDLRLTRNKQGPMVAGIFRPVIYLPESLARQYCEEKLYAVLLHEAFHVKRGDLWVALVQEVARVLFFHHPAVWWVNARLTALREEAVDQAVLSNPRVGRQAYSMSLVEAAAQSLSPRQHFAIGVVETKTQLKHRIEMILHQSRPRRVNLGYRGTLSILLIGLVLVPMMPAIAVVAKTTAPSSEFREIDPAPLKERIDATVSGIMDTFNQRDLDGFVNYFDDKPFVLAEGSPLISGREGVTEMYLQSRSSIYEPMQLADRGFYRIGDWIVETGLSGFNFRLSPSAPVMTDPRQFITLWEEQADGSLRVKLLSWNKLADTGKLNSPGQAEGFETTGKEASYSTQGDFGEVLEAEELFHRAFPERDFATAASYYADGATLVLPERLPLHGRETILAHLKAQLPQEIAVRVERQPVHVEGNGRHVLVINLFRWTFQPPNAAPPVTFTGKGVHIWERGGDGSWKILFDLPNGTGPAG